MKPSEIEELAAAQPLVDAGGSEERPGVKRNSGARYLADCDRDPVEIACARCNRDWSETKASLLARFGDVSMPTLIQLVAQCERRGNYTDPCQAHFTGIDYAAQARRYQEAMARYKWISQLAATDARVFVQCRSCGRRNAVARERLQSWLARLGKGRDLSIAEVQRRLRCGFASPDRDNGFGCGQKLAELQWIASENVPPPDPTLRRPGERR